MYEVIGVIGGSMVMLISIVPVLLALYIFSKL
jgi:hypothetical protein